MDNDFQFLFKMVIIGDSGVGKSNLMTRYTADEFSMESQSTIGVEFMNKSLEIEGRDVKVQIWDTAGQERFRAISRSIYHGTKGALLVYDITSQSSFDNLGTWLQELRAHAPSAVITLIGNKCDLESARVVQPEQAKAFATEHQLAFLETSARDSKNVEEAFTWLAKEMFSVANGQPIKIDKTGPSGNDIIDIGGKAKPAHKTTCSC
eukprot:TRINITY_DN611_c0_g3_i2.p1 TRINITY_DN611_c0_g3~~TRINITY_DN611_c0_g3_i2.p1  ORF type:complete len:207 (+),score=90.81 TRINITY_DN611_c0_g3_i2:355-975(+)